jgi:hypothetical protein
VPVTASLPVALDAPAEEVEALIDMGDQGLVRRQAQAHRGQDICDLLPEGFSSSFMPATIRHQSSAYADCRIMPSGW